MPRKIISLLTALALLFGPIGPVRLAYAGEPKVKYAKTEVEKAAGKCVGSVLGGALLGALAGRVIGGRGATGTGAAVGAAAGVGLCAVLIATAKRRDRIIQAQIVAANYTSARPYVTSFENDKGEPIAFQGRAGTPQSIEASRLLPVRYKTDDGEQIASPVPPPGGHQECRPIYSTLASNTLPMQYTCRTPEGDWRPYSVENT